MKQSILLSLAVLPLTFQSVCADNPELEESNHSDLPHAFDAGWEGQKTCELLFEDAITRISRCVFPPGVGHEKHYHNPHFGYVLEGGVLMIRNDQGERKVTTVKNGSWSTTGMTVHEALNIGDTTTSYLIVEPKIP